MSGDFYLGVIVGLALAYAAWFVYAVVSFVRAVVAMAPESGPEAEEASHG